MNKKILRPIALSILASAVMTACSSSSSDNGGKSEAKTCAYNIQGGNTIDIMFGTVYSNPSVKVTQEGKSVAYEVKGSVDASKLGKNEITYSSESCSNNQIRTVNVVASSCAYKLNGASPLEVLLGGTYDELGVEVKDINNKAVEYKTTGTVDTSKEGDYELTYQGVGCKNSQKRVVKIKAKTTACNYELKGNNPLVVALNGGYTDLGVIAKTVKDDKNVENITVSGDEVDTKVAKDYEVVYQGEGCSNDIKRTVSVKAPTKCTYNLSGTNPFKLVVGNEYVEPGFSIKNANDKIVTTGIAVDTIEKDKIGEYKVTYQDSSCTNSTTRIVKVIAADCAYKFADNKNPLTLYKGDKYTDAKPTVKDADGADISATDVSVKSNNVDTTAEGSYEVVYEGKGCPNTAVRKVEIVPLVCTYTPKDGPVTVVRGHSYTDPGVVVVPDVTVTVTGAINTSTLGKQSIKYQGEGCENNVERFVEVVKPERPDPKTVLPNI